MKKCATKYILLAAILGQVCLSSQFLVDQNGEKRYDLKWKLSKNNSTVTFTIKFKSETDGWIGLGVSKDGNMMDSDMAVYEVISGARKLQVKLKTYNKMLKMYSYGNNVN
jgi:hypothetical protein